jgi:hypothetical protein
MTDIDSALAACRAAADEMMAAAERAPAAWTVPRAAGKWSPSQIVEHVARTLEESANVASGKPSKFPNIPALLRPLVRRFLFERVLRNAAFPKARTNKAMNPTAGPASLAEGRVRLAQAQSTFETACRALASRQAPMQSTAFGPIRIEDYVRFMEIHARHHTKQIVGH